MMPSYFFAHGAPTIVLEDHAYNDFLKSFAANHPKPKGIVVFSAHWEEPVQTVSAVEGKYETIYDFGGFQKELYEMIYPAPGDLALSRKVSVLFAERGIVSAKDEARGLDHGAWAVLKLLYPDADIPVVALSVNRHLSNEQQYEIGRALAELRKDDILIMGSGGTVHNLRQVNWGAAGVDSWAADFDKWLEEKLVSWDLPALFRYQELAPQARAAVPTSEHFIPLLLAMGAGDGNRKAELLHRSYQYGNLSLSAWEFQ